MNNEIELGNITKTKRRSKYNTLDEYLDARNASVKKYYQNHKEEVAAAQKERYHKKKGNFVDLS